MQPALKTVQKIGLRLRVRRGRIEVREPPVKPAIECRLGVQLALQNHTPRKLIAAKDLGHSFYFGLPHQCGSGLSVVLSCPGIHHFAAIHAAAPREAFVLVLV